MKNSRWVGVIGSPWVPTGLLLLMEKRKKTGRKPIQDRSKVKIQIPVYIRHSIVESAGGKDEIRKRIYEFLEQND